MAKQVKMSLPGSRPGSGAKPDVYTALLFLATVALLAASGFMWGYAHQQVSPEPGAMAPFSVQESGNVRLPN
ncbi:MAG: hypothetical protein AAGG07_06350 [Planctomycetota bacterium]